MRNQLLIVLFIFGLTSCTKEPTDSDIEDGIKMFYMHFGMAEGSGSWKPKDVKILKKETDKNQKDIWLITSEIKGIYVSPPLGNPVPDEEFCDTLMFSFEQKKNDIWECTPLEYDPVVLKDLK